MGPFNSKVNVQLYCLQDAESSETILDELMIYIKKRRSQSGFNRFRRDPVQIIIRSASEINTNLPLVLVCFNYARIGSVVKGALAGITIRSNVALVILHHKDVHALPSQRTELTESEYTGLGAIIDMGYLPGIGIYKCEKNDKAIDELIKMHQR